MGQISMEIMRRPGSLLSGSQQIILLFSARAVLHDQNRNAGFRPESYETLQSEARESGAFQRKINDMEIVQGDLTCRPPHFISVEGILDRQPVRPTHRERLAAGERQ